LEESWDKIKHLAETDPRFRPEAYLLVLAALEDLIRTIGRKRHVSGQELCEGIRRYVLKEYGLMSKLVLESWGCRSTDDFGHIVYNLISVNMLSRTETDRIEDFHDVYDFDHAFTLDYPLAADRK